VYVITGLGLGGAELQLVEVARKFNQLGHEIHIISLFGETLVDFGSDDITVHEINMNKSLQGIALAIFRLRNKIIQLHPDVVHSHMVHANIISRLVRAITPIKKLICTAHSNKECGKLLAILYKHTNRWCDVFTHVSEAGIRDFIKQGIVNESEMVCVYNGIDTDRFQLSSYKRNAFRLHLGINKKTPLIISVGRLTEPKDYPTLLESASYLVRKNIHFHWMIIGDGPLKEMLEQSILDLDLVGYVTLVGSKRNVESYMAAGDCFVLSSQYEGFGLVVAEAMAMECPVVVTDCGGVAEIVGEFGEVVPVSQAEKLAKAIENTLLKSSDDLAAVTSCGRKRVIDKFSLSK
ncbi:glycosyltransferase, partial [Vibrio mediterranei]|uniref:glycosyltransferase n=1 Tax=Vibrio mediterranei TaxID=689 RepID=UPI001EFE09B8